MAEKSPRMGKEHALTHTVRKNPSEMTKDRPKYGVCFFCLNTIISTTQRRAPTRFCSARHRLLFWALDEIVKEWQAGKAEGLREKIKKELNGSGHE